jgi:3-hydroxyacyl-CoA dehydrogenase
MEQGKRLAVLQKIRDELKDALRSAINKGEISPENRSEVLSRLASIQREVEALTKPKI